MCVSTPLTLLQEAHFGAQWSGFGQARDMLHSQPTGVQPHVLKEVGRASVALPPHFVSHDGVEEQDQHD